MPKQFSESDWRKALEAATKKTASGFMSRREIEDALKLSRGALDRLLHSLHSKNQLESQQEQREAIDGKMHPISVYRIKAGK